jgi:DNA-binding PadR family transcriptional regulator
VTERHFLPGTLDLLVLAAMARAPRYGYDIAKSIGRISRGEFRVLDGALYASLYRLQRQGWVASAPALSEAGRAVRVYRLTPDGRREYRKEHARWLKYQTTVSRVLRDI